MHILSFIGFLVAYATWIWASSILLKQNNRAILENKTFWTGELFNLLGLLGLFSFIFLLSGYFNLGLVAALFGAGQIGVVLAAILGGILGSVTSKWGARTKWAGGEFGMKNGPVFLGILGLTSLIVLAYPVAAGISYFGLPASQVPTRIFQYTLTMVFFSGYPMLLFVLIGALVSENLDEDTRIRFFVSQLSALVPNALWLALLFWSFGIAGAGQKINVGNISLEFSPILMAVLIGFFVLTVLIPYLIGAQCAKQWRSNLMDKQKNWMARLSDILETPAGSLYLQKLATLQNRLDDELAEFVRSDPMIAIGMQLDQGIIPPGMEEIGASYLQARDQDPRFKHLDWLRQMSEKIGEIRSDLGKLTTERELEKAAIEWMKYLQPRLRELSNERDQADKTRTPALLIYSSVIVPIFSVFLSEFAKWLWVYFSMSLPQ